MTQPEPISILARLAESSIETLQERCDGYERMWRNSASTERAQAKQIKRLEDQIEVLKAKLKKRK